MSSVDSDVTYQLLVCTSENVLELILCGLVAFPHPSKFATVPHVPKCQPELALTLRRLHRKQLLEEGQEAGENVQVSPLASNGSESGEVLIGGISVLLNRISREQLRCPEHFLKTISVLLSSIKVSITFQQTLTGAFA